MADEYAKAGFYVYIPDFLKGKRLPKVKLINQPGDSFPLSYLKDLCPTKGQMEQHTPEEIGAKKGAAYGVFGPWVGNHSVTDAFPIIQNFVRHLRADPSHKKIGAVGMCWGGWSAIKLVQKGIDPFVDASVACHPGFLVIPDDAEKVERPLNIHVGSLDDYLPLSEASKIAEVFKDKPDCSIDVYEDQVHGFASRGDLSVEKDRKAKEEVAEKVQAFFFGCSS